LDIAELDFFSLSLSSVARDVMSSKNLTIDYSNQNKQVARSKSFSSPASTA
jgi:hypothetical protein